MAALKMLGHLRHCGASHPHPAHTVGEYTTVRHGPLNYICVGLGPEKGTVVNRGSAMFPAVVDPTPSKANADNFVMGFTATESKKVKR